VSAESLIISSIHSDYRPYVLLEHAQAIITSGARSRELRADVLVNLRRAVDFRIKNLVDRYNFKRVPLEDKPRGSLELLEFFGIVQPLMAGQLIELRNAVEHEDHEPPDVSKLKELSEFTWYFLRSTDLRIKPTGSLSFDSPYLEEVPRDPSTAPPYRIVVDIDPNGDPPWEVIIQGFVPTFSLTTQPTDGHMVVDLITLQSRSERQQSVEKFWWERNAQVASGDDCFIKAKLRGSSSHIRTLVQRYVFLS
jgi:hypothetical protein